MPSRSFTRRQLSRSKIDLFVECPRCFYLDVARGTGRPSGPPFTLNLAVDSLLKAEFDSYRTAGEAHPLFEEAGIEAVPFPHPELERWRHNFTGLRWLDEETGWTLFGAIDDVWQEESGELIIADYKATARAQTPTREGLYPSYQRQMEVYQFLMRRQGFEVSNRAWFVYCNGIKDAADFGGTLRFTIHMVPYDGEDAWVLGTFRRAVATATGSVVPQPGEECKWCGYVENASTQA